MDANFTQMLHESLPKTAHVPHLLLRSREDKVQLYTNYPLVTGISPEICADTFNRQTQIGTASPQGDFVHFTLSQTELQNMLSVIAAPYHPAPPALPSQGVKYLQYVITVLLETYPVAKMRPFTPQEQALATLIIYMAQRKENVQKRQHELTARVTALRRHIIFTEIPEETRILLRAAHVMLQPIYPPTSEAPAQ